MVDLFGSGDGGRGLYSTGTGGELLGHDPRAFVNASRPSARVELDNPELFADVRPTSALVPSLVIGRVIGGLAEGRPLAIAVNGRIGAVADTVRGDTGVGFQAMVPPAAFRPGPNRLAVLAIEGTEGRRRLARLGMERTTNYRLTEKDGTTVIDRGDSELRVQPGRVKGYVEQVKVDDQAVRVIGWAADVDRAHPAARIVVFDGSKLIAETRPTEIRADIVKAFKDFAIARCGFHLSTNPRGIDPDRLRVFAISGDGASELSRTGG